MGSLSEDEGEGGGYSVQRTGSRVEGCHLLCFRWNAIFLGLCRDFCFMMVMAISLLISKTRRGEREEGGALTRSIFRGRSVQGSQG